MGMFYLEAEETVTTSGDETQDVNLQITVDVDNGDTETSKTVDTNKPEVTVEIATESLHKMRESSNVHLRNASYAAILAKHMKFRMEEEEIPYIDAAKETEEIVNDLMARGEMTSLGSAMLIKRLNKLNKRSSIMLDEELENDIIDETLTSIPVETLPEEIQEIAEEACQARMRLQQALKAHGILTKSIGTKYLENSIKPMRNRLSPKFMSRLGF